MKGFENGKHFIGSILKWAN